MDILLLAVTQPYGLTGTLAPWDKAPERELTISSVSTLTPVCSPFLEGQGVDVEKTDAKILNALKVTSDTQTVTVSSPVQERLLAEGDRGFADPLEPIDTVFPLGELRQLVPTSAAAPSIDRACLSSARAVETGAKAAPKLLMPDSALEALTPSPNDELWEHVNLEQIDIKYLFQHIRNRGDLNGSNSEKDGYGVLYLAAANKHLESMRLLLLDPNVKINTINGPLGATPMHMASHHDLVDGMELLVEHGGLVNVRDATGQTPLHQAVYGKAEKAMRFLLDYGRIDLIQSPPKRDSTSNDDTSSSSKTDRLVNANESADALQSPPSASMNTSMPSTPLDSLRDKTKLDINSCDLQGNTPLHLAISQNFPAGLRLLLEHGADPNVRNAAGLTPIANAITLGHTEAIGLLIEYGADVQQKLKYGRTLLHHAVHWNCFDAVRALVEANVPLDTPNLVDETALYLAVQQCKIDIVNYLLQRGASPTQPQGINTSLLYAAAHGYWEMCDLLVQPTTSEVFLKHAIGMAQRAGFGAEVTTAIWEAWEAKKAALNKGQPTETTDVNPSEVKLTTPETTSSDVGESSQKPSSSTSGAASSFLAGSDMDLDFLIDDMAALESPSDDVLRSALFGNNDGNNA